jgi:hypothetical protein
VPDPRNLILRSIVPLGAVPEGLRAAVSRALAAHGHQWAEVTLAGTALLPIGRRPQLEPRSVETWIFALSVADLRVGDEIHSGGGVGFAVSVPTMPDGFLPSIGYSALVYESLAGSAPAIDSPTLGT